MKIKNLRNKASNWQKNDFFKESIIDSSDKSKRKFCTQNVDMKFE